MNDQAAMATNDYISECKSSAVTLGYFKDKYISMFIDNPKRKSVGMHRHLYTRVIAINLVIQKFLKQVQSSSSQIVNLGSGFDTLFWRLLDQGVQLAKYVEIDFPPVTSKKCYLIEKNPELLEKIRVQNQEIQIGATDLHAGVYHLVAADLNNLSELKAKLKTADIDFALPTLFIAEGLLMYMNHEPVDEMLAWFESKFKSALFLSYEMCGMDDFVGETISSTFQALGVNVAGMKYSRSLDTQMQRFLNNKWHGSKAWDATKIYDLLPNHEKQRVENMEYLDKDLSPFDQHYCICIAWLGTLFADIDCVLPLHD